MSLSAEKVRLFKDVVPENYSFFEALSIRREIAERGEPSSLVVNLVLTAVRQGHPKLTVKFLGVRDLRVGNLEERYPWQISIVSVREQQLENIAFKVRECEDDAVSFYCADFSWSVSEQ